MSQKKSFLVEVCVDSLEGALVAEQAGADRLELNAALELDGLTPSSGLTQAVLDRVSLPVISMVRPRSGDFCYRDHEWQTMLRSAAWLVDAGVAGLAFGAVTPSLTVDLDRCLEMRHLAAGRELVFHKAFDVLADWSTSTQQLIDAGVDRVMTSGRADGCLAGISAMQTLCRQTEGRLGILPAGGILASNVVELVRATGLKQVHGSFSTGNPRNYTRLAGEIRAVVENLQMHFNQQ